MFYDTRSGQIITISTRIWTKCLMTWGTVTKFVRNTTSEKLKKLTVRNSGDYYPIFKFLSKTKDLPHGRFFVPSSKIDLSESCQKKMIIKSKHKSQNPLK